MNSPPLTPPGPLPAPLRRAAFLCLVVSAAAGYASLNEAMRLEALPSEAQQQQEVSALPVEPEMRPFVEAAMKAHILGLSSMKTSRQWILGGLWVATLLSLVGSMRLFRPARFPRDKAVQILGRSTFAAALLRVIDGAQMTAVAQRMGNAAAPFAPAQWNLEAMPTDTLAHSFMVFSAALTFLVAGLFLALSMYFRSEKTQQLLRETAAPLV